MHSLYAFLLHEKLYFVAAFSGGQMSCLFFREIVASTAMVAANHESGEFVGI